MAPRIASVLYGVIAIMTVDLAVQPDRLRYSEAVLGVLLIGLAMAMTRLFVRVVTKEAEIGAHLPIKEFWHPPTRVDVGDVVSESHGTIDLIGRLDHDAMADPARHHSVFRRRGCVRDWLFIELRSGSRYQARSNAWRRLGPDEPGTRGHKEICPRVRLKIACCEVRLWPNPPFAARQRYSGVARTGLSCPSRQGAGAGQQSPPEAAK